MAAEPLQSTPTRNRHTPCPHLTSAPTWCYIPTAEEQYDARGTNAHYEHSRDNAENRSYQPSSFQINNAMM